MVATLARHPKTQFDFEAALQVARIVAKQRVGIVMAINSTVEDVAQDLVLVLHREHPKYDPSKSKYCTWATGCATSRLIDMGRAASPTTRLGNQRKGRVVFGAEHDDVAGHEDTPLGDGFAQLAGILRAEAAARSTSFKIRCRKPFTPSQWVAILALQMLFELSPRKMAHRLQIDMAARESLWLDRVPSLPGIWWAAYRTPLSVVEEVIAAAKARIQNAN